MEVPKVQNSELTEDAKDEEITACKVPSKQDLETRYTEPIWARVPTCSKDSYYIEVIKNGTVIERISLHSDKGEKSYLTIGRFDPCEIKLEHPSVSRFHSVLQYGEHVRGKPQWFIFDMNSTHGVRINKKRIEKSTFVPLLVGYVFQIAASSRIFVLCGGPKEKDESENESNPEVFITKEDNSELKSDALSKKEDEDTEMLNYRYYEKDPIHWLERYFEREGASMDFRFTKTVEANDLGLGEKSKKSRAKGSKEDDGSSTWICSIELISDVSLTGSTLVSASAPSKRLAQLQCSLLACERLDAACLLQISNLWNKRKKYAENDFYAEDEDIFYDRTGQLEEQREKRKRWYEGDVGLINKAKTHNDLVNELEELNEKILVVQSEIERLVGKDSSESTKNEDFVEEGKAIKRNFSMRMTISQLKSKEKKLLEEKNKTARLVEITKPVQNIFIKSNLNEIKEEQNNIKEEEFKEEKIIEEEDNNIKTKILKSSIKEEENKEKIKILELEQIKEEENKKEEKEPKFYAPAMPPKSVIASITPRFGVLTKQELIQMKLLQRQEEGNKEALLEKKRRILDQREENKIKAEKEEQIQNNSSDMYATWLPPEDQSGDGSTKLNRKFEGKY
uniref:FHA domain-containing protein n=1 Tax=Meloidogyne incognita TaxID=6306 RepID=A0A914KIW4_MELIC